MGKRVAPLLQADALRQEAWVSPTGFEVPDPGATVVWLDLGLAFGTGTHPTTALCLDWLDANLESGACVIDYGCGSGVLGVAAALLGAERVVCIDNDPQALDATYANAARNGIEVECGLPDQQLPEADVVLANILAGPLIELRPKLCGAVRAGVRLSFQESSRTRALCCRTPTPATLTRSKQRSARGGCG